VEEILAYQFNHPSLLLEAMTHPSYAASAPSLCSSPSPSSSPSYQRLEFLGDALLGFLLTEFLYDWTPSLSSGDISDWKAYYVSNEFLSAVTVRSDLMPHLRHYSTQLQHGMEEYVQSLDQSNTSLTAAIDPPAVEEDEGDSSAFPPPVAPAVAKRVLYSQTNAPKVLADVLEALLGAIFLDSGARLEECRKIVSTLILEPFVIPSLVGGGAGSRDRAGLLCGWGVQRHPVSVVQEIVSMFGCHEVATSFSSPPSPRTADPPLVCCQVSCHGELLSKGSGRSKRSARLTAALQLPPQQLIAHLRSSCTCSR
jgi:dsRNA-specific ribonuclease